VRAAIYAVVSSESREPEGTSLDTQREACLKFAHDKCLEVSPEHVVTEAYSGLTIGRPRLQLTCPQKLVQVRYWTWTKL
jgi:site-specific DNA recombinase